MLLKSQSFIESKNLTRNYVPRNSHFLKYTLFFFLNKAFMNTKLLLRIVLFDHL